MDPFKIELYEREFGIGSFPKFRPLNKSESNELFSKVLKLLELEDGTDRTSFANIVESRAIIIENKNASSDNFNIKEVFVYLGVNPERVYLDWDNFDKDVDEILLNDFCEYFNDIWFHISDDLFVIDKQLTWLLIIHHEGFMKVLKL